ncbi:hypothetical protein AVEN_94570-1 [Araneus ventricosus]|uniref:Uncharacterized protein n=1 Tax=Araneus ventricosus TaxID=182803 RepID=A0A4Y2IRY8_ARAVE|nr:hypothetical protein AVEN_94570-1 [Araneus ventricosus]
MVIGEVDVIATEKKRKGKQMEDKRIKRKMVRTDAAHAQSMELLELNTMSSSLYTDTDDTKYHPKTTKDEHYTLVNEHNSVHIGHVTAVKGGAKAIEEAKLNFFASNNLQLNGLTVIGCDGTNVNTVHRGGIIRLIELASIDHYNGEFVCFKKNELPLRHLLNSLDGATTHPKEFCRPIDKAIRTCKVIYRTCS